MIRHRNASRRIVTARIGKGRAIHVMRRGEAPEGLMYTGDGTTLCRYNHCDLTTGEAVEVEADEFTCRKCLKVLAAEINAAHAEALQEDAKRDAARLQAEAPAPVFHNTKLYGPDGRMHLVEGSGLLPFDAVWLTDTTTWDTALVSVTTLLRAFTAYPPAAQAPAPVEVADLHVRKVKGGSDLFRVLGTETLADGPRRGVLVVWLENVLTRVQHHVRPDTLESHYVATDQDGNVQRAELRLRHGLTGELYVFEGFTGQVGWLRHFNTGKLYSMTDWVIWTDYSAVCAHGNGPRELCEGCGELDANGDQVEAPRGLVVVPNTVEAWKAYAETVKAARDAAEAQVAELLTELGRGDDGLHCGRVVEVPTRTGSFRGRVSFIGHGRRVVHVKPLDGGVEVVRLVSSLKFV